MANLASAGEMGRIHEFGLPLFPPPGLPWGHALYMRPKRLTLVDRRTGILLANCIARDLRKFGMRALRWKAERRALRAFVDRRSLA